MAIIIDAAQEIDLPAILALLEKSVLPQDGLSDHVATTLVAREDHAIVGSAALELYGTVALLRSVAVADQLRGQGLGQQLTKEEVASFLVWVFAPFPAQKLHRQSTLLPNGRQPVRIQRKQWWRTYMQ